jgi:hypothetical protein
MTHPVVRAARAAGAELTSESAQKFFRDVAIAHTLMTAYYLFEFCCDTYEAGQKTRAWVEQRRAKGEPPAEAWTCAGLLSAAPEIEQQAIATLAAVVVKTNQQKLEDQITKTIQGIYNDQTIQDNSTNLPVCVESINPSVDPEHLELVHGEDAASRAIGEVLTVKATASRSKTRSASGDSSKGVDKPSVKGRVPRKKPSVLG